jgi:ATP-dependent exoDNAse (exonuclease V) alpha subunit
VLWGRATIQGVRRYLGAGLIKGIGPVMAERMVAHFGTDILRVIEKEPQRLIDVPGVKTADTIARAVGIPHESPERIKAGLQYTLSEAADGGHCFLPAPNLITEVAKILDVSREMITPCLDELAEAEGVIRKPFRWASTRCPRCISCRSTGPSVPWHPAC